MFYLYPTRGEKNLGGALAALLAALLLAGCSLPWAGSSPDADQGDVKVTLTSLDDIDGDGSVAGDEPSADELSVDEPSADEPSADELLAKLDLVEDFYDEFDHGQKGADYQRYIVLHDTEGTGDPENVVSWWASNGNLVAAHFVIGTDGHIVQCVPLDRIAHHAGYGNTGNNEAFGIAEDGRDDMLGSSPIGSAYADYAMNAWSIGIELVHVGGAGDYPEEQLQALDDLIAYIDAYYGFESEITDHKAWRTSNSDTSKEFAGYLANYQDHRTHE